MRRLRPQRAATNRPRQWRGISATSKAIGGLGLLFVALSLSALIGWYWQIGALIRVSPGYTPIQLPTVASFSIAGMAAIAVALGRAELTRALTVLLIGVNVLTAAARLIPADSAFGGLPSGAGASMLSASALDTSLAFLFLAIGLRRAAGIRGAPPAKTWTGGFCGLACLALGGVSLLATLSGQGLAQYWPTSAGMAVHTAGAFVVAGGVLTHFNAPALFDGISARRRPSGAVVGAAVLVGSAVLWLALVHGEHRTIERLTEADARRAADALAQGLNERLAGLKRLAASIAQRPSQSAQAALEGAGDTLGGQALVAIAWVDRAGYVRVRVPPSFPALEPGDRLLEESSLSSAATRALTAGKSATSAGQPLPRGGWGVYLFVSAPRSLGSQGMIVGAYDLREELRRLGSAGYGARIVNERGMVAQTSPLAEAPPTHAVTTTVPVTDGSWGLSIWPRPPLLSAQYSRLPNAALVFGVALGAMLAVALRAREQLADSAATLERRVEERTAALAEEVRHREALAEKLAHAAEHDSLTGLPNRRLFQIQLEHALARAERDESELAVMFLDLDRFKEINDTLGHHAGDELLVQFAQRVQHVLRHSDVLARHGGDEFLILIEDVHGIESVREIAEKVLQTTRAPFNLSGRRASAGTSIGVALFPESGTSPEQIIKNADAALYQVKGSQRGTYAFYSERLHVLARARARLREELSDALAQRRVRPYYQPRLDLTRGTVVGAEALARWYREDGTLVSTEQFVQLAEENGLIVELGDLMLHAVLSDLDALDRRGLPLPQISVNVASRQLANRHAAARLLRCLSEGGDLAGVIELELTERVLMDVQGTTTRRVLDRLVDLGCRIAVDDFGTGYSSLTYLQRFPIHTLKIDRSFVEHVTQQQGDATITRAVIDLARNFGMTSVAEGVETKAQLEFLRSYGCNEAQGYLFGPAVPPQEFFRVWHSTMG